MAQKLGQVSQIDLPKLWKVEQGRHTSQQMSQQWAPKDVTQIHLDIKECMIDNHTYPKLINWVPKYLLRRGIANLVDLGDISQALNQIEASWPGAS